MTTESTPKTIGSIFYVDVGADYLRVCEAYGEILGLRDDNGSPRPATNPEIEASLFNWLEGSTGDYERRKNMAEFTPPPFEEKAKYKL